MQSKPGGLLLLVGQVYPYISSFFELIFLEKPIFPLTKLLFPSGGLLAHSFPSCIPFGTQTFLQLLCLTFDELVSST
jgi:hypothetical protein